MGPSPRPTQALPIVRKQSPMPGLGLSPSASMPQLGQRQVQRSVTPMVKPFAPAARAPAAGSFVAEKAGPVADLEMLKTSASQLRLLSKDAASAQALTKLEDLASSLLHFAASAH